MKTNPLGAEAYVALFERAASQLAERKGCDHVICAHIHQPKIEQFQLNGEAVEYLNAGDWIDNLTALEYRFGKWKIHSYDADDYPTPSKLLRIPLARPNKGSRKMEEELMRTLVNA